MKRTASIRPLSWFRENVPCLVHCPVRTDCGRYVQLIAEGRYEEAWLVARAPNPLASVCARVCAAPCEDACRRGSVDRPVTIRALKRFVSEQYGPESRRPDTEHALFAGWRSEGSRTAWHLPITVRQDVVPGSSPAEAVRRRQPVAVVGAGPAGLACAHDLGCLGYAVTVFEASDAVGGMMRYGVPAYRLPRQVIDTSVARLRELGVTFQLNARLGADYTLSGLRAAGFRAIFLGVGAQSGRDLNIEGHDLDGVIKAVDYLLNVNHGYRVSLGDRVVVIGGGSVALDAARTAARALEEDDGATGARDATPDEDLLTTAVDAARLALRSGAREVHVVALESEAEMPAARTEQGREELAEARREGVITHFSRGPHRFIGEAGRLRAVELVECLRVFDENGRFNPTFAPDRLSRLDADTVILAVGQAIDLSFLSPADGVAVSPSGAIRVNPDTMETTAPGVFAGGDAAFGPRIIIDAEAHGKRAAASIHRYLDRSASRETLKVTVEEIPTREYRMAEGYDARPRHAPPALDVGRRLGVSEVEEPFDEREAVEQASRCLHCHVHPVYDAQLCVMCGRCVDVCPHHCLEFVPLDHVQLAAGDASVAHDRLRADTRPGQPTALLKDEERCIRCGLCAVRCPTGAFTMERFAFEEVVQ